MEAVSTVTSIISPYELGRIMAEPNMKEGIQMYEFCRGIMGRYGMGGFSWFGGIAMLVGVVLVGVVIYLLVSNRQRQGNANANVNTNANAESALTILKERLAKGEIDEETYDSLLKKLNK